MTCNAPRFDEPSLEQPDGSHSVAGSGGSGVVA